MTSKNLGLVFCAALTAAAFMGPPSVRGQGGEQAPHLSTDYTITGALQGAKGMPAAEQTLYFFVVRDGKVQGDAKVDLKTGTWKVLMPAATSDAKGNFTLPLPAESFERFRAASDRFTLGGFVGVALKDGKLDWILTREVRQAGRPLSFGPQSFSGGRKLALGRLTLGPDKFSVTGALVDPAGTPVKAQAVYLLLLQKGKALGNMKLSSKGLEVDMPTAVTDAAGRFQIAFDADFVVRRAGARAQGFTVGRLRGSGLQAARKEGSAVEFGLDQLNRQTGRLDLGALTFDSK